MNSVELKEKLKFEKIPSSSYTLLSRPQDETLRLELTQNDWVVFYSERGLKSNAKIFSSENDACKYFLKEILSWFKK